MTSTLLGAVCASRDARERLLARLVPGRRRVVRFGADAGDGECGFLCAPAPWSDDADPRGFPQVVIEGHLLTSTMACLEGAQAARHLAAVFQRGGAQAFGELGGNHAFVLVDGRGGVWIRRDAGGCKPLFLAQGENDCVFGSSALEVARVSQGQATLGRAALHDFLRTGRALLAGTTPLVGVRPVPAGQALALHAGGIAQSFDQRPARSSEPLALEVAAPLLWARLCEVVAAQGGTDTTASTLSGGLDSSSILAARCASDASPVRAFSFSHGHAGLPAAWNERSYAEQASTYCGADTTYIGLDAASLPQLLAVTCAQQDFPFGSPVVLAQAHLFRRAAEAGVTRLLSGHGPDTLFGGGTSHLISRAADLLAAGRVAAALRLLAGGRHYAEVPVLRLAASTLRQTAKRTAPGSRLMRELRAQLYDTIVPVSLITEECSARACDIDNRQPFLERSVLGLAADLAPEAVLPADGETKAVLRRAVSGRLPAPILARRLGVSFAVPVLPWLLELEAWAATRWAAMPRLAGVADAPFEHWRVRLRGGDARAWGSAFAVWRRLILAAWMEANDVRLEAA